MNINSELRPMRSPVLRRSAVRNRCLYDLQETVQFWHHRFDITRKSTKTKIQIAELCVYPRSDQHVPLPEKSLPQTLRTLLERFVVDVCGDRCWRKLFEGAANQSCEMS